MSLARLTMKIDGSQNITQKFYPFIFKRVTVKGHWILYICECHEQDEKYIRSLNGNEKLSTQNWHQDHLKITRRRWMCRAFHKERYRNFTKFHFGTGNISFRDWMRRGKHADEQTMIYSLSRGHQQQKEEYRQNRFDVIHESLSFHFRPSTVQYPWRWIHFKQAELDET